MKRDPILVAATRTGFSAYVPHLPGCIATGQTMEQVKKRMQKAVGMHLAAMQADGDEIREPSLLEVVEVG
jgi:predicted RNase H-like HicB family nuclease